MCIYTESFGFDLWFRSLSTSNLPYFTSRTFISLGEEC